ncbi:MAG: permease-like cell division protein FtsX [Clostridia bacterium]|nr:permease-like cell division protein FtsX [Clostridia bacterium]
MNSFYFVGEGFRNVLKNKKSSLISLITMICAMFIFGVAFAIGENATSVVEQVSASQGIQVYMTTDATDEQINQLESDIWNIGTDKIQKVEFVSKQQALETMKTSFEDADWIFDGYEGENNIFPVSYIVSLTDLSYTGEVEKAIGQMDNVDKIRSSNETIDTLIKIAHGVRLAVIVIFVLLIVMAVTIISNTIKLTVHSRRREISIMKYVGATDGFIRGPFVVEGIIIGLIAALLTILMLGLAYDFIISKIAQSDVLQRMNIGLLSFGELSQVIAIVFLVLGIGIGIVGSSISMKKYLEV